MAKRVQNDVKKEYTKELERILRIVRKGEQEGYIFPKDVVPRLPKHITKQQLEEVKNIKEEDLYELADLIDKKTGEIIKTASKERTTKNITKPTKVRTSIAKQYVPNPRVSKEKPEPLTPKELAEIRSNAGKKAWKTRTSKMTPDEYKEFVNQSVERMQRGRAKKRGSDYPTKTAIDSVTERVLDMTMKTGEISKEEAEEISEDLSTENFPTVDFYDGVLDSLAPHNIRGVPTDEDKSRWYSEKSAVLSIWQNTITENAEDLGGLEEYLLSHMSEIDEAIRTAEYGSTPQVMLQGFGKLGVLLNQGALTAEQAEQLSNESEFIEYDEESYEELAEVFGQ